MLEYQQLLKTVADRGVWQYNKRTNTKTKFLPAYMLQLDVEKYFPLVTLRQIFYKGAIGETLAFLRGYTRVEEFESLGCKFWSANANEPTKGSDTSPWLSSPYRQGHNDLGEIYGSLWTNWQGDDGHVYNQIKELIKGIKEDPSSRRLVVSAWKPENVYNKRGALPPCHDSFNIIIDTDNKYMHLNWRQRSTDIVLGTPSNLVSYGLLLTLLARLTGYTPKYLTAHLDNVHIYENHMNAVNEMIRRTPLEGPSIEFSSRVPNGKEGDVDVYNWLDTIEPNDITISNYEYCNRIDGLTMAV